MLSHSTEKLRRGTFLLYTKFLVSKYIMDEVGGKGGMSVTIFCQKFFDSEYRKTSHGTFLCFTKFLLSKNFMDKRWVGGKE